jgi:RNA polymerase sigma-70 factor, ECF subfamily
VRPTLGNECSAFMTILAWSALSCFVADANPGAMSQAPTEPADESLVRACLGGDESAFAELISRHKSRVFGTCGRFARDAQQLDDLAQEVFLRVWRKMKSFRGDAPFEHWLARLTVSACYDFLRRERRHRDAVSLDELTVEMRDGHVDGAIAARSARELVNWAMRQLNADEQLIITLLELEERPVREIAALTGWSESNVKVRAFRARARLKTILSNSHES